MKTKTERQSLSILAPLLGAAVALPLLCGAEPVEEPARAASLDPPPAVELGAVTELSLGPARGLTLRGQDARHQLVVSGRDASGAVHDLTRRVELRADPPGIVDVDATGFVVPLANGRVSIAAILPGEAGSTADPATLEMIVESIERQVPVNFPNQVVPIFTKHGCNGGGCHGKSGGQNGFRLSLLGFYPREDHEYLVKESRGRRIFGAAPELSLLLQKATNELAHGGGQRLERDSDEFRILRRWMLQGMPYGEPSAPRVERIEAFPRERRMRPHGSQQLSVLAHYSDGSVEDVTRMAQYEANRPDMAEITAHGLVTTLDMTGDVGVMVRYQGHVDVFRATIPLGARIQAELLPPVRNFIDERILAKLEALGLPPSQVCDDATFLRRVTIDVAGRLPDPEEARSFLADSDTAKRDRLIDRLVDSSDYADHFAGKWSAILRNRRDREPQKRGTLAFHAWIRESLLHNLPYDEFVRAILAASGDVARHPPVAWYRAVGSREEQAEDSAQLFLGMRIQCARCHHHPFERWSQGDYAGYSAFFSRVGKKDGVNGVGSRDEPRVFHRRGIASARNPRTGEDLRPRGLGGETLDIPPDRDPRLELVRWMTEPGNPFFARSLVNRYWKHFFGRGLVEPEDDMRVTNPPTHPDLLADLARHFVESGYDLKDLVRTICRSSTYQLTSIPGRWNGRDQQNYSRFYPRRLQAEVLRDALHEVIGSTARFDGLPAGTRAVQLPDTGSNIYFLSIFGRPMGDSACECERTEDANLAQSLHLLNSKSLHEEITADDSRPARYAGDDQTTNLEKLTDLYLHVYSRVPTADETRVALSYLEAANSGRQAWEDIVWALVNTKEFLFNH